MSTIFEDAQALLQSFRNFGLCCSLPALSEQGEAVTSSQSGLVTVRVSKSRCSIFAYSGILTRTGSLFREPLNAVLVHYFPGWLASEDWLIDFLESDRRFAGLSTPNRRIAFRKSAVGIFVDVEQNLEAHDNQPNHLLSREKIAINGFISPNDTLSTPTASR